MYLISLVIMTIIGAIASLYLKKASGKGQLKLMLLDVNLYTGAFLYFITALINIWILKYLDYSLVLPLTSLTYVWTMILAVIFLKEFVTKRQMLGIMLIVSGAVLLAFF